MIIKTYFALFGLMLCTPAFSQLSESELELLKPSLSYSSDLDFSLEMNVKGLASSAEHLPFWMYHNQRGRISEDSNMAAWISAKTVTFLNSQNYIVYGASMLYRDGTSKDLVFEEAFAHYQNTRFRVTLGRKHRPELYNGLSATNESILWSLNARPLPGIQISTTGPVFFRRDRGLGFEAGWEEYLLNDERYVDAARLHHKNLRLVYAFRNGWEVKAGIQHFAQWGGTSPMAGELPQGFSDYLLVVAGREGGADAASEEGFNTLGNHLGGYEIHLSKLFRNYKLQFVYNHLYEDRSGKRLGNTPDGRYSFYYEALDKDQLINSVIYELYYTEHQSHTTTGKHKYDNYFNHSIYRSGFTYEDRVLGAPFFIPDSDGLGISNNKFRAHHVGIGGQVSDYFNTYPYKLLLSYSFNDGIYVHRYRPKQAVLYGLFDVRLYQNLIDVNLQLGAEYNSYTSPNYGAGIQVGYRL